MEYTVNLIIIVYVLFLQFSFKKSNFKLLASKLKHEEQEIM
jgi:hypothetical protein